MKRNSWILFAIPPLLMASLTRAEAQVSLTTNKPVYTASGPDSVVLTVTNHGTTTVTPSWSVWADEEMIYKPADGTASLLGPGKSQSRVWKKKDLNGKLVWSGSYTISIQVLDQSGIPDLVGLHQTVALTPTGKIAGNSRFPLAVGNSWNYEADESETVQSMEVKPKPGLPSGKYLVANLVGINRFAKVTGATYPTLFVFPSQSSGLTRQLFQFNRPLGYTYWVDVLPLLTKAKFQVGALKETVVTLAGIFTGCYRLDVVKGPGSFSSFWFAPGVGLVQYRQKWDGKYQMFRLRDASLHGSDGKWYSLGQD